MKYVQLCFVKKNKYNYLKCIGKCIIEYEREE